MRALGGDCAYKSHLGTPGCLPTCDVRGRDPQLLQWHCQSKIYTACSRIKADWSSTVFAHELTTRSAGLDAENLLYLFALTMPRRRRRLGPRLRALTLAG